jgi:DNA uptake protein ComE-like DNA-binding protein
MSRSPARAACRRRGFALLAVLWLLAALSGVAALSVGAVRVGHRATVNRVALARGRWAAEACLAVAQARWPERRLADTATMELGRGTTCRWLLDDPTARLNLNTAEVEVLEQLATATGQVSAALIQAILERRATAPFLSVEELRQLGADSSLLAYFTVDGPGTVNLNSASAPVLSALPGMTAEAVARVIYRRSVGRPVTTLDDLAGDLSAAGSDALLARYADLARVAAFTPPQLVLTARGWVGPAGGPEGLHATIELLVVPLPQRLATIRRRMW